MVSHINKNIFPIADKWLYMQGIILPNEHVCLTLSIFVDDASASHLNLDADSLQHTLILHTIWGKDHFIVVSGRYRKFLIFFSLSAIRV